MSNTNGSRNQTPDTTSQKREPETPVDSQSAGSKDNKNLYRDESSVSAGERSSLHRKKLPQQQLQATPLGNPLRDIIGIWGTTTKNQTH
jgi:hypothetical protein